MTDRGTLEALAEDLARELVDNGWMCATAESCTGGGVARVLTEIAGSSSWFERGFVTYSNDAKLEMLGVSFATIERFGAVSEETAREMAQGALRNSRAQASMAVTGIAGPAGGSPDKPVGTVAFAWAVEGKQTSSAMRRFDGDRRAVREAATEQAIEGLLGRLRTD
ncbi:MAG: CinA family protein [Arenicellales bacterium]